MNQLPLIAFDMPQAVATFIVIIVVLGISLVGFAALFAKFYRKVGPEEAIVRSGQGGLQAATGSGIWVVPILHVAAQMDLSAKRIDVVRAGESGIICSDNIRADIQAAFVVRVNNTREDILNVAQSLGVLRASTQNALVELFEPGFSEALETVAGNSRFSELRDDRARFKEKVLKLIGTDLNGYIVDDFAVNHLEQTPVEKSDPLNILVGQTCLITTPHSTNNPGQARHVQTDAAPLLMTISSTDSSLAEGDLAVIVGFDSEQHTYSVEKVN